jgi:hypothetical protein
MAGQVNASMDVAPGQRVDVCSSPSQRITLEMLRRSPETTQYTSIAFGRDAEVIGARRPVRHALC